MGTPRPLLVAPKKQEALSASSLTQVLSQFETQDVGKSPMDRAETPSLRRRTLLSGDPAARRELQTLEEKFALLESNHADQLMLEEETQRNFEAIFATLRQVQQEQRRMGKALERLEEEAMPEVHRSSERTSRRVEECERTLETLSSQLRRAEQQWKAQSPLLGAVTSTPASACGPQRGQPE